MTLVKICGITNLADAEAACAAGADALGFNFYRRSPRYIEPAAAREIIAHLPREVLTVGVFVNEREPARVAQMAIEANVAALQLHGDESPEYCAALAEWPVIKALRVGPQYDPAQAARYRTHAIMLDAYSPRAYGGTGLVFDWTQAQQTRALVARLFLAGGLTVENVAAAISAVAPFAVDVCSGVESTPGVKDLAKVRAFLAAAREAEEGLRGE
jgi:phosphoribosylanthranilate isomerase